MRLKMVDVILTALSLVLIPSTAIAQSDRLGHLTFPATGKPEAAARFVHGVLLLHSFEYDDAREQFAAAERADPAFVMAYWGEAMSFNQSIWWRVDLDGARAALLKLGPSSDARLAKAPTARERGYLEAVEALFGDGDKAARDRGYSERMGELTRQFPDDDEASLFYALSLLAATEGVRDETTYLRAASLAEAVFAKNPQHPGAAHYLIHCYDDPRHAQQGLAAALAYSSIAPSAQHALHMPSHVFYALGRWDDAARLNEASAAAADERVRAKQLGTDERGFHALLWLEYAVSAAGSSRRGAPAGRDNGVRQRQKRLAADAPAPRGDARRVDRRGPRRLVGSGVTGCKGPEPGRHSGGSLRDRVRGRDRRPSGGREGGTRRDDFGSFGARRGRASSGRCAGHHGRHRAHAGQRDAARARRARRGRRKAH